MMLAVLTFLLLVRCSNPTSEVKDQTTKVDSLFRAYYEFKLRINPIEATKLGEYQYNDRVANYISNEYQADLLKNYTRFLASIQQIDSAEVKPSQWLSLRVMKWDCEIKKEGLTNELVTIASPMFDLPTFELMPLAQITSLHLYFSQLAGGRSVQPFNTLEDYENWLHRVDEYLIFLDTCIAKMKQGIELDVVMPKALIRKMIPQLDDFIKAPTVKHVFYGPINIMPLTFSPDDKSRLTSAYTEMISNKIKPKYLELRHFLKDTYLPAGRESSGLGDLPNGPETYTYLIRQSTTTNLSANEIHELGKSEVERIEQEMKRVKNQIGFEGDLKSFFNHVRNSKSQMPYTDPQQVIDNFNAIHDRMSKRLSQVFDIKPKATFEVRRTEAFREASASAEYVPGTKDGSRPGVFYVPIPEVTEYNKYNAEALFLHEAVPGHHYQLSLQQENESCPNFYTPKVWVCLLRVGHCMQNLWVESWDSMRIPINTLVCLVWRCIGLYDW